MSDENVQPVEEQVVEQVIEPTPTQDTSAVKEVAAIEPTAPKSEELPEPVAEVFVQAASTHHVVSGNATDDVFLESCVFKNQYARKSLTVHHVQRRLAELGFKDADSDKDGWYGDLTRLSVEQFQKAKGIEGDGLMNAATFSALFAGDSNVTVRGV